MPPDIIMQKVSFVEVIYIHICKYKQGHVIINNFCLGDIIMNVMIFDVASNANILFIYLSLQF